MFTDIYPSINVRLNNTSSHFFQQMLIVSFIETQCGSFIEGYDSHLAHYGFISTAQFALTVEFSKKKLAF